jgi:hypothetical protein
MRPALLSLTATRLSSIHRSIAAVRGGSHRLNSGSSDDRTMYGRVRPIVVIRLSRFDLHEPDTGRAHFGDSGSVGITFDYRSLAAATKNRVVATWGSQALQIRRNAGIRFSLRICSGRQHWARSQLRVPLHVVFSARTAQGQTVPGGYSLAIRPRVIAAASERPTGAREASSPEPGLRLHQPRLHGPRLRR